MCQNLRLRKLTFVDVAKITYSKNLSGYHCKSQLWSQYTEADKRHFKNKPISLCIKAQNILRTPQPAHSLWVSAPQNSTRTKCHHFVFTARADAGDAPLLPNSCGGTSFTAGPDQATCCWLSEQKVKQNKYHKHLHATNPYQHHAFPYSSTQGPNTKPLKLEPPASQNKISYVSIFQGLVWFKMSYMYINITNPVYYQ